MNTHSHGFYEALPAPKPSIFTFRRSHYFEHYYRLMLTVIVINLFVAYYAWQTWFQADLLPIQWLANIALYNFALGILIRQQYVINALFKMATFSKTRMPLWLRWRLGKVYHFGGLHSGATLSGSLWFLALTLCIGLASMRGDPSVDLNIFLTTLAILLLLVLMLVTAMGPLRAARHNLFERCHRFVGWAVLGLFHLLHIQLLIHSEMLWYEQPSTWLIGLISLSILLPWLRLKKVPVEITKPSNHAVLARFDYGVTPFPGSSMAISLNPLLEWHSFANIPSPDQPGYRLAISRAGDWTGAFIDQLPSHVWVKGIPTAGVANIEVLFKKVVYIATGSGIGPVLPHLLAKQVPSHLVWTTRSPRQTYGDALVDEILQAEPDAQVWNTDELGKPDMVKLSYQAYKRFGAEAVIIISNQKLTRQVVYGLESRGIPAYGAIWDS